MNIVYPANLKGAFSKCLSQNSVKEPKNRFDSKLSRAFIGHLIKTFNLNFLIVQLLLFQAI